MIRYLRLSNLIIIFLFSLMSLAQSPMSTEALDIRNRIESEITRNLQNLVSTQLDPKTFTIAVRAQLTNIQPPKPKAEDKKDVYPAGLGIGSIDVRELLTSYEKQIEELKLKSLDKKENKNQFQLSKLEVVVGLDEAYGKEYTAKFEKWLSDKMRADYGSIAKSTVGMLKFQESPLASKNADENGKPETPIGLKDLIPLALGTLILVGLLIFAFLIRGGLKQIATAQKSIALESRNAWALESKIQKEENEKDEQAELPQRLEKYDGNELNRLTSKIAFVCLELGPALNDLVRVWIDSGDDGFTKAALLIDTLVNAQEKIMSQTGAMAPLHIPLDQQIVTMREESLAEAYRNVQNMPEQEKIDFLEEIYWDLVSFKTLGLQSLRRPFDFLQGMPKENITELLMTQKNETRALTLMYLPSETQSYVMREFSDDKRIDIIKNMLAHSQISQKQIWDVDTSVKVSVINQSSQPEEKLVNLFPRTIEVLESLNQVDEIRILRQVSTELPERGLVLKQQYSSLAFVDEWKPEYIRKLSQVCTADEIGSIIRQIPQVKELILSQCGPKVRTIVEDDLKVVAHVDPSVLNEKLTGLKSKWNRIVVAENLPMSKVIDAGISKEGLVAVPA